MNKIITFILALGFAAHVLYIERIEKPKWKTEVSELKAQNESLSKALKQKAPKTLPEPEPFVEPEFTAPEVVEKTVEKPVDKPAEVVTVDNSAEIAALEAARNRDEEKYKALKAELVSEMKRGTTALNSARGERAPFNDSRIRTSEADKQIWYNQRDERVKAIQAALEQVRGRLSNLESTWNDLKSDYARKIRDLK